MSVYRFGDWLVEPELSRIRQGQDHRHLEPKALAVLLCLLEHAGKVVSQEELLATIWKGRVVDMSAVARNVALLRRALGDDSRQPIYIATIPKKGYRAVAPVRRVVTPAAEDHEITPRTESARSLAVLPFENLSADPEDAFFAAGIHAEVSNRLAGISDLAVIARTTMLGYASTGKSVPEVAAELGVGAVLEGSVRYAGQRVRITVQLSDATSGSHLWSDAYEGDVADVFGMQLAVAREITRALKARLSSGEQTRIAARSTASPEAYAHYLRAISGWGNWTPTRPMHEAIDAAIAADPKFADALAYKAFLHGMEASVGPPFTGTDFGPESQRRLASSARAFALRALELDAAQAYPYWVLGWVELINRQWQSSQQNLERAYELDPNDYIILNGAAWASLSRGDIDTGVRRMQRCVARNPGDVANQINFADFLYRCQSWERARRQGIVLTVLAPDSPEGYLTLALVAAHQGDSEAARSNAGMAETRCIDLPDPRIAVALGRVGDAENARRIVRTLEDSEIGLNAWTKFWLHLAVDEKELAIDQLDLAIEQGFPWQATRDLRFLSEHPMFDPIRGHPRFRGLVQRTDTPAARGMRPSGR